MALPVNIDDLVNYRKVEWARIESDAETMRELNAADDPITVPVTDPVPHQ